MPFFDFTEIREVDGKQLLYDPRLAGQKEIQAERLLKKYEEIRETLLAHHYPAGRDWIEAIAEGGSSGLKAAIIAQVEADCKRLKTAPFVTTQWTRGALADLPAALEDKAEALCAEISRLCDGLPFNPAKDLKFTEEAGLSFDLEQIKKRIEAACGREITDHDRQEAAELREIVGRVRKLAEDGLDAVPLVSELAGTWLAPSRYPDLSDDLAIFRAVCLRRHTTKEQTKQNNPEKYYLMGGE